MAKLTISISDSTKELLDKHKTGFNVSRVCAEALERELAIYEALSGEKVMTMVERLREEAKSEKEQRLNDGRELGVVFARDAASLLRTLFTRPRYARCNSLRSRQEIEAGRFTPP